MQISGSNELLEQIQKRGLCVGCGSCAGLCPYFQAHRGTVAMTFSCDREEGRCYAHCPRTPVDYEALSKTMFNKPYENTPLGTYRKIVSAKAVGQIENSRQQNGGTVTALMTYAMDKKLIDAAVVTESKDLIPTPKIVTDKSGIQNAASTKYMAAPTVSKVNEGLKQGFERLGVVGTPCQMTAIAKMKTNPLKREDFKNPTALLIGLFCTWAVDTRKFIDLVSEKTDITGITGMDIPPPPAELFILKTTKGNIEIPLDEIREIIPKGCSLCPDMTAEWSDVSVGAFEGQKEWNTLIIRTQLGEDLVNGAVEDGYLIVDKFPQQSLSHLTIGAENKKTRGLDNQEKEKELLERNDKTSAAASAMVGFR